MKKVKEFLFVTEAVEWVKKQKEPNDYLIDRSIFSGKFEVYLMD